MTPLELDSRLRSLAADRARVAYLDQRIGALQAAGANRSRRERSALEALQAERQETAYAVSCLEAVLPALSTRERFLVQRKLINNEFWRDVERGFEREFGEVYSRTGLKQNLMRARRKLCRLMAEEGATPADPASGHASQGW